MVTMGELISFGGWPVVLLIIAYPFGIYKIMDIILDYFYPESIK